jgi:hypothetical protein
MRRRLPTNRYRNSPQALGLNAGCSRTTSPPPARPSSHRRRRQTNPRGSPISTPSHPTSRRAPSRRRGRSAVLSWCRPPSARLRSRLVEAGPRPPGLGASTWQPVRRQDLAPRCGDTPSRRTSDVTHGEKCRSSSTTKPRRRSNLLTAVGVNAVYAPGAPPPEHTADTATPADGGGAGAPPGRRTRLPPEARRTPRRLSTWSSALSATSALPCLNQADQTDDTTSISNGSLRTVTVPTLRLLQTDGLSARAGDGFTVAGARRSTHRPTVADTWPTQCPTRPRCRR